MARGIRPRVLVLAALIGLLPQLPAIAAEPTAPAPAVEITREALREGHPALVLDVRSAEEYHAGHVPGAVNIPHDEVEAALPRLEPFRSREVVVYCRSGRRAALALAVLGKAGFTTLEHLAGDMQEWTAAGLPVDTADVPLAAP